MKSGLQTWRDGETETPRRTVWENGGKLVGWCLVLVAGAFVANFAMRWQLPLPFCLLRETTGIPCPACGCTRSLAAWSTFDLARAFRFNPLFFISCLGLSFWTLLRVIEGLSQPKFSLRIQELARRLPLLRIGLTVLAANWVYLYLTLPR